MTASTGIAIRTIISALESLASSGEQQDEPKLEITWSGGGGGTETSDDIRSDLQVAQAATKLLKKLLSSANATTKNLRQKLADVETTVRRDFRALPNEVLAIIFEMLSHEKGQIEVVRNFSLVSRRFREIITRIPSLWSQITSEDLSAEQAELFASRVTTSTIALSIARPSHRYYTNDEVEIASARIIDMFQVASSISSRIRTLGLTFSHSDAPLFPQLRQTCSSLSLPCLTELDIRVTGAYPVGNQVKSFCTTWNMPSLRVLAVREVLLELRPEVLSQIENCTLKVNSADRWEALRDDGYWPSDHIVDYILSLTSVKVLELAIRLLDNYDPTPLGDRSIMATVEDLTLGFKRFEIFDYQNILTVLHFPFLTGFRVELWLDNIRSLQEALSTIPLGGLPRSSIDTLAIAVNIETKYDDDMPLDVIGNWSKKFGKLKCLSLESERNSTHALLAFADSIDGVHILDPEGQTRFTEKLLAGLPHVWGERLHGFRHRTAVVTADAISRRIDYELAATYTQQE